MPLNPLFFMSMEFFCARALLGRLVCTPQRKASSRASIWHLALITFFPAAENFAAAETSPSAISAASNITIPTLIFSGEDDCVAPPISNQNIMFDSLNSICKTQINIINGGHCYFANENTLCSFGESSCNPNLNITRNEQQSVTNDFLKIWLNFYLKSDQNSFSVFNDSLQSSNRITYSQFCNNTAIDEKYFDKELIRIIDILGRQSKGLKNQPLFYIYDDGTVEKQIIIE